MTHPVPPPYVLDETVLPPDVSEAVLHGAVLAQADVVPIEVAGPGAIMCLQGLLTNDVEQPGEHGFVYGAILTPKGMIVSDLWLARSGPRATLFVPRPGHDAVEDVFRRTLPPRLARPTDRSGEVSVFRLVGPRAPDVVARAGIALPGEGHAGTAIVRAVACEVARPADGAPFILQLTVAHDDADALAGTLVEAGALSGEAPATELARILAGWPRLGAEIDGKTLPQEVRFDEHDGVSYTKGCYTGQETVARVHFRGHPNRRLVGLAWDELPDLQQSEVIQDDRPRGRVSSVAWLAPLERHIGLGIVRREVDPERGIVAAGAPTDLVPLPFDLDE